jgi:hypothetical protein
MDGDNSPKAIEAYRASLAALKKAVIDAVVARQECHDKECGCSLRGSDCPDRRIETEFIDDEWGNIIIEMLNKCPKVR